MWCCKNGSQKCLYDCSPPIAFRSENGNQQTIVGNLVSPAVVNSELPGLLGLTALRKNRAVLDFTTLKLYFCGPADYNVAGALPEGTDTFQLEVAPSGHIVLPCCEFDSGSPSDQQSLTLLTRNGRSRPSTTTSARVVPPPPTQPPILPINVGRNEHLMTPPVSSA